MSEMVLNAKQRTVIGKQVRALRREGLLPAVLYGTGIEPISLELELFEASKVLSKMGSSTLVSLKVGRQTHQVLVREIQRDVIRRDIKHVDFLKVAMDVVIRASVPVELVGEALAVSELGGVLVSGLAVVEVEALPSDLPDRMVVDLELLVEIEDTITVSDLSFGEGVEVLTSMDEVLARVIYQVEEEIEEEEVEEEEFLDEEGAEVIDEDKEEEEETEKRSTYRE
jgi:large subunit ribosomal protein L25